MIVYSMGVVVNVPLGEVDIGLLADQVGVTATDTLDLGQRVHDLLLAVNIGVEQTQDELEVRLIAGHERCYRQISMLANIQFENRRLCHRFLLFFFGQIRGCISYNALRLKGGVVTYT